VPAAILIALLYVDKRDDAALAAGDASAADATAAADVGAAVPQAAGPTVAAQR
jgi:hypothetical protein